MILFLDTSALVKLYIAEEGSEVLCARVGRAAVAVSNLAYAEAHATFARRLREGLLDDAEHRRVAEQFEEDWQAMIRVSLGEDVLTRVPGLCLDHPLRGGDTVQLASASLLRNEGAEVIFAASDRKLLEAARAEGLRVFDPAAEGSGADRL